MKMSKLAVVAIFGTVLLYPMTAFAEPIVQRQVRQETRIYQGVKNGSIDRQEYQNLQRRERSVAAQRARDVRDGGRLTHYEKKRLDHRLNRISHDIHRDKHN